MTSPHGVHDVTRGPSARLATLPVPASIEVLLPDAALVRGRVMSCTGPAGPSLAFAVAARAVAGGSWLAAVSMPWIGLDAVIGLDVDPGRFVRIDVADPVRWAEVVVASLDGFEVIVAVPPHRLGAGMWRKVQSKVRSHDAALILVGAHNVAVGDITLHTSRPEWTWVRGGAHLRARRVHVEATGRRMPRLRRTDLWLPAPDGSIASADSTPALTVEGRDGSKNRFEREAADVDRREAG